jgi:drug/metabolite transporter (DMT)-like permease
MEERREIIMGSQQVAGLVLLVVGVILLYFGWQSSQSLGDQLTEAVTGRFTDNTMWFIIGGAAAVIAGAFMAFVRR